MKFIYIHAVETEILGFVLNTLSTRKDWTGRTEYMYAEVSSTVSHVYMVVFLIKGYVVMNLVWYLFSMILQLSNILQLLRRCIFLNDQTKHMFLFNLFTSYLRK